MPTKNLIKDVKYLDKRFSDVRNALIDFSKIYFPNEYSDFSDSSVGMMFIEMTSYVADMLSLYIDTQLRESMIQHAINRSNIVNIAQSFSYIPKLAGVSYTNLDVYQIIPATSYPFVPDWRYALKIKNLTVSSETNPDISFRVNDVIDFAESGSQDTEVTVFETNATGDEVTYFLLKKQITASSGIIVEKQYTVGEPQKYFKIVLPDEDIIDIISIYDSDGNQWHEVPYLAQDTVLDSVSTELSSDYSTFKYTVPFLLRFKKVAKRFTRRVRSDNRTEIQFGAGTSAYTDEILVPNPDNIGYTYFNSPVDPRNFMNTRTYGQVPANTTLTIRYVRGTDELANRAVGDVNVVSNAEIEIDTTGLTAGLVSRVKSSLAATNTTPAVGSRSAETNDEIRQNAMAYFAAQDRCVTAEDYETRILSMHPKYGRIAKVKIVQDEQIAYGDGVNPFERIPNPLALNAYCLGYDSNKNLVSLNSAIKSNLKNYLEQYRMVTDAINIKDAYIINIQVNFEIITYPNVVNKREVIIRCIDELKTYFDISKWYIGQPIVLSEIYTLLDRVEGVRTVSDVSIINKFDNTGVDYSVNVYDVASATIDGVVYTSLDPSCFEVKYPNKDIFGRAK
ncbi:MAG: hypothetical protein JETCAE03_34040 [Ignavibacteriaceae bacterium]|jgi:hypothetical protein|nr:MAG: hypothetical protein JETCAE03_34040 [Ignavibacteriaceae bacterium]